jgi:hypothetical protein
VIDFAIAAHRRYAMSSTRRSTERAPGGYLRRQHLALSRGVVQHALGDVFGKPVGVRPTDHCASDARDELVMTELTAAREVALALPARCASVPFILRVVPSDGQ